MPAIEYDNFLTITLFKLDQCFRRLDADERENGKKDFADLNLIGEHSSENDIRTYSTVGTRADAELMLVQDSPSVDTFHELSKCINQ